MTQIANRVGKYLAVAITMLVISSVEASSGGRADAVTFREHDNQTIDILIGDQVFAVLNHGKQWAKPFLYPVYSAAGKNILRPIIPTAAEQGSSKDGTDHFHHKGVWVSVDSVNDEKLNFWHEKDRINNDAVEISTADDGTCTIILSNNWMKGDDVLLKEVTSITIHPTRLLTYRIELKAVGADVTFHDTKEGFFAVRIATSMREMDGGRIENADGIKGEKECWGKPSAWIDYVGDVEGTTAGVTLMDAPGNLRPSRYHVRSYGLFAISPFGPKTYSGGAEKESPITLKKDGESLKLTYGMYVHEGETADAQIPAIYEQFVNTAR